MAGKKRREKNEKRRRKEKERKGKGRKNLEKEKIQKYHIFSNDENEDVRRCILRSRRDDYYHFLLLYFSFSLFSTFDYLEFLIEEFLRLESWKMFYRYISMNNLVLEFLMKFLISCLYSIYIYIYKFYIFVLYIYLSLFAAY